MSEETQTVSFVLDFLPGPWGWGWLLVVTVKQPMWCLSSSLKTSALETNTFSISDLNHTLQPATSTQRPVTRSSNHRLQLGNNEPKKGRCAETEVGGRGREVTLSQHPKNTDRVCDSCGEVGLNTAAPSRLFFHMKESKHARLFQESVVFEVSLLQNTATIRSRQLMRLPRVQLRESTGVRPPQTACRLLTFLQPQSPLSSVWFERDVKGRKGEGS